MSITELHRRLTRSVRGTEIGTPDSSSAASREIGRSWIELGKLGCVTVQLALLALVIAQFQLENRAFQTNILFITVFGFVIHYFLPQRFRLQFFLVLSLAGILTVFGLSNGGWLIAIGLGLIGLCHLPLPFWARVALLAMSGGLLAWLRADPFQAPWSLAVWPILGSMFMFRLIIYMYDLRHSKERLNLTRTLSYFFLLPNVCFPLFPVIDYATFKRTYYNAEQFQIYQRGAQWMLRGITQLIIYRFVYEYLTVAVDDVTNVNSLVQYLIANYLLYLRVSGQFHLVVGMLHLFGFHLPETHHLYFLASSFTDLWRRINIYWKDFVMKVVYYPTYFHLRRLGGVAPLVIATIGVFAVTWLLHSYQWFWLRGSWLFSDSDMLFWTLLGILLVANSLYETRFGRDRLSSPGKRSTTWAARQAVRIAATFFLMCVLWSLWTSPSLSVWLSLWSVEGFSLSGSASLLPLLLIAAAAAAQAGWSRLLKRRLAGQDGPRTQFFQAAAVTGASILGLYALGNPAIYSRLGPTIGRTVESLRVSELNRQDATLLRRGYYENLAGIGQLNSQLFEIYMQRPPDWPRLMYSDLIRTTDDFLRYELKPSVSTVYHGAPLHTNRWGMRDQDYALQKPPGTFRVVLLGSSSVMGEGVADDETFEAILEDRLNREAGPASTFRYEILNFGVGFYNPLQHLITLENKASAFGPDAVYVVAHTSDPFEMIKHIAERLASKVELPYDSLRDTARTAGVIQETRTGVTIETRKDVVEKRLQPYAYPLLATTYRRIVELCRAQGAEPVWIYLPLPGDPWQGTDLMTDQMALAREAGFTVLDLSDAYAERDVQLLKVAPWDNHPNARAHRLIADRIYRALQETGELFMPGVSKRVAESASPGH